MLDWVSEFSSRDQWTKARQALPEQQRSKVSVASLGQKNPTKILEMVALALSRIVAISLFWISTLCSLMLCLCVSRSIKKTWSASRRISDILGFNAVSNSRRRSRDWLAIAENKATLRSWRNTKMLHRNGFESSWFYSFLSQDKSVDPCVDKYKKLPKAAYKIGPDDRNLREKVQVFANQFHKDQSRVDEMKRTASITYHERIPRLDLNIFGFLIWCGGSEGSSRKQGQ